MKIKTNWLIKVTAIGVPALLIMLGFIAYFFGSSVQFIINTNLMSFGETLIYSGIGIYLLELLLTRKRGLRLFK